MKQLLWVLISLLLYLLIPISGVGALPDSEMIIQKGHSAPVNAVNFSPDGRFFISGGSYGNTVKLWNARGQLVRSFSNHAGKIADAIFNHDGTRIAVASYLTTASKAENNTIRILHPNGTLLQTIEAPGELFHLAYSPVDNTLAGSIRKSINPVQYFVVLWDAAGKMIRKIEIPFFDIHDLAFRPDGKALACAGWLKQKESLVKIISLTGEPLVSFARHSQEDSGVDAVAFSPDGKQIVSGTSESAPLLWKADGGEQKQLPGPSKGVHELAFSRDGRFIAGASLDGNVYVWNRSGKLENILKGHTDNVTGVDFSPNQTLVSGSYDGSLKLWTLGGDLIRTYQPFLETERSFTAFGQNQQKFIHWKGQNSIDIWSAGGKPVSRIEGAHSPTNPAFSKKISHIAVSPDGATIATTGPDQKINLWDMNGRLKQSFSIKLKTIDGISFTPDSRELLIIRRKTCYILTLSTRKVRQLNSKKKIRDVAVSPDGEIFALLDNAIHLAGKDGRYIRSIKQKGQNGGSNLIFSPDGTMIATWSRDSERISAATGQQINARLWHIDGRFLGIIGPKVKEFISRADPSKTYRFAFAVNDVAFSPDGKTIACGGRDDNITLWDLSGKLKKTFEGHSLPIHKLSFSRDGRLLLSTGRDGTLRLWRVADGKNMVMLQKEDQWITFSSDGFFDASRNGGDLVAMVTGTKAYSPDQFAAWFNRPDKVLAPFGLVHPDVLDHYQARFQRRLKRMDLRAKSPLTRLHVPQVQILAATPTDASVELAFQLSDDDYPLKSYNIYVNDVPLFGANGKPVNAKKKKGVEEVELSAGNNKIEISCTNEQGAESFRFPTHFQNDRQPKGDLYYIGFGISRYQNPDLNLKYADQDAGDLATLFQRMQGDRFNKVYLKTILNDQVTKKNIGKVKHFLAKAGTHDTVVLFIAGHGVHDRDPTATYYYLTHTADLSDLAGTCARFKDIEDILQGIRPRQKLFLMDTCESGEIEDDGQKGYLAQAGPRGARARAIRGIAVSKSLARKPVPRSYLYEKNRYIYNDLVRRSGAIVFSSSRGNEFSYEDDSIQNGYFTEELIKVLSGKPGDKNGDGIITTDELRDAVSQAVAESTGGLQNPTVDRDNIYVNFGFPVVQ
ncbi:MAG: hypothetical protein GY697_28475 [Desulfobacterales bacterium]|nr:hypothetical protein [Desulfobacterales bacterium]